MDKREALEINDYLIDETVVGRDENKLLDWNSDGPAEHVRAKSHVALAEIAAAIHKNARHLNAEQLEQGVRWLKKWKLQDKGWRRYEAPNGSFAYSFILDKLRVAPEQAKLQRQGFVKLALAGAATLTFLLVAATAIALMFGDRFSLYWRVAAAAVAVGLLAITKKLLRQGIEVFKEQDRRYALQSLREAVNVVDLIEGGLFSYIPGTMLEPGKNYDQLVARKAMRDERERLADVLYTDPDNYLDLWQLGEQAQTPLRFTPQSN